MDEQRLKSLGETLNALRTELRASFASDADNAKPVSPDRAIGRLTRQDAMLAQQMALELRRRNKGRLSQVEAALRRIDEGVYGYCVRCEEEIGDARLNVRPETPVCIRCAENRR